MATNKRFFWLKLFENFYSQSLIRYLRKLPSGDTIVIIYQELLLSSIRTDGYIYTDGLYPTVEEDIALKLDEDLMDVKLALPVLEKAGLLVKGTGEWDLRMTEFNSMVGFGSETASTQRSRDFRRRKRMEEIGGDKEIGDGAKESKCVAMQHDCNTSTTPKQHCGNADATARQQQSNADIDIETDIDIEKELDINTKYSLYGKNHNVRLNDYQFDSLKKLFPKDYLFRIDNLSEYMAKTGKQYQDHYITMINWSRYEMEKKIRKAEMQNAGTFEDYSYRKGESY